MHESLQVIDGLTRELAELVSYGYTPERLASFPIMKEVMKVGDSMHAANGRLMLGLLVEAIASLAGIYTFKGHSVPAGLLKRCYLALFNLDPVELRVGLRREPVIIALQKNGTLGACKISKWRTPPYEGAFLQILAEHIVTTHEAKPRTI